MSIQPIETRYAGHKFRSRLEARWAVFFDALGIEWQYEPQGYLIADPWDCESRPYLPDFYLSAFDVWVEVKGDPSAVDWGLWGCAVDAMSHAGLPDSERAYSGLEREGSALLVLGNIPPDSGRAWLHPLLRNAKGVTVELVSFGDYGQDDFALEVSQVGVFDAAWDGFNGDVFWMAQPVSHDGTYAGGAWKERANPTVAAAYDKARQARFEHGASG